MHLTDPDQAVEFVARTGLDALAVAIGTSHGAYKFDRKPDGEVLAMNLIEEIHERLPETHLVMHGSSSVPRELVDIINRYGGKMKPSWGVPVEEIQLGIRHGVRKINVDTDSRLAITGAIRKAFAEHPEEFDPRSLPEARPRGDEEGDRGADDRLRPGRPRRRLRAHSPRGDARALRQRRDRVSLADIDEGLRAAGGPAVVALLVDRLGLDEDDISAATRRGLLLAAAAGDPAEGIAAGSRAALETAADLAETDVAPRLLAELRTLAGGGPRASGSGGVGRSLADHPEAALSALAVVLLSIEAGG